MSKKYTFYNTRCGWNSTIK